MRYRLKPRHVEALQYDGVNLLPGMYWDHGHTNERIRADDWLIYGLGDYPQRCINEQFEDTYEVIPAGDGDGK